jgi:hypothetical protein
MHALGDDRRLVNHGLLGNEGVEGVAQALDLALALGLEKVSVSFFTSSSRSARTKSRTSSAARTSGAAS